ncbi:MAG: hypothetical protein CML24_07745, partial [Rhizobiales bacterium]|nr:hypothetical protein [Hyphomicrobiales bacterium]
AMKQAQTVQTAQMLMVKKQHEMEMSMISMLTEAVENAPAPAPAGMGANVDKRA